MTRTPQDLARLPLVALAALLGSAGCLRQTGAGAMSAGGGGSHAAADAKSLAPVEASAEPDGTFMLDGEPFCFAGTNNYYLTYKPRPMVDDVLESTKRLGLKVMRIWGYIDRGAVDGTVRDVDGPGKGEVYFQYWDPVKKRPAYNDGVNGLDHLDYVLDKARQLDLKVMLVLTNNWKDFGGMDQYAVWYGLAQHSDFYSSPATAQAYKDWVAHLVNRKNSINGTLYRDDPTIFGWELANEPRCRNYTNMDGHADCDPARITRWADGMSAFIKSVDPNHMVSVGDEGFFASGGDSQHDGSDGVDHKAFLALKGIDFGTYHLYPDTWQTSLGWASQWIEDHIDVARAAGKPTLLEEYGIIAHRDASGAFSDDDRRAKAYPRWHEMVEKRGGNAAMFWMLAGLDNEPDAAHGKYPDFDGFVLYPSDPAMSLVTGFASTMATGAQACTLYKQLAHGASAPKSHFVTALPPPTRAQALNASTSPPPT